MRLKDLLYKVSILKVIGSTDLEVLDIQFDSRKIISGSLFVAISGDITDGHNYIEDSILSGAKVIIVEKTPQNINNLITYVKVSNSNQALAIIASNFYNNPSEKIKLIGVTGTNGKTTVATLLYQLFQKAGYKVGLLSTVKVLIEDQEFKATHTTPDSITINAYLAAMVDAQVTHCFMEVSSHGIHQKRTHALQFDGGIFTNLLT